MAVVHERGTVSARDIQEGIDKAPSYSAVRALIRILERKGHLRHESVEGRHIYRGTVEPERVRTSALRKLMKTFFDNSAEKAVSALLSDEELAISDSELERLEQMIERARLRERPGCAPRESAQAPKQGKAKR